LILPPAFIEITMWIILSLAAAMIWGLDYLFAEKVLQKISIPTFLALELSAAALTFLIYALFQGTSALFQDTRNDFSLLGRDRNTLLFLGISTTAFVLGNLLIVSSIKSSNATWAGLIEITYPLFIILFGWLLFREHHLTPGVIAGGGLIFAGVIVISLAQK